MIRIVSLNRKVDPETGAVSDASCMTVLVAGNDVNVNKARFRLTAEESEGLDELTRKIERRIADSVLAPVYAERFRYIVDSTPDWWKALNGVSIDVPTTAAILSDGTRVEPGDWVIRTGEGVGEGVRVEADEEGRRIAQELLAQIKESVASEAGTEKLCTLCKHPEGFQNEGTGQCFFRESGSAHFCGCKCVFQ